MLLTGRPISARGLPILIAVMGQSGKYLLELYLDSELYQQRSCNTASRDSGPCTALQAVTIVGSSYYIDGHRSANTGTTDLTTHRPTTTVGYVTFGEG